jgi:hypothetical protein
MILGDNFCYLFIDYWIFLSQKDVYQALFLCLLRWLGSSVFYSIDVNYINWFADVKLDLHSWDKYCLIIICNSFKFTVFTLLIFL